MNIGELLIKIESADIGLPEIKSILNNNPSLFSRTSYVFLHNYEKNHKNKADEENYLKGLLAILAFCLRTELGMGEGDILELSDSESGETFKIKSDGNSSVRKMDNLPTLNPNSNLRVL